MAASRTQNRSPRRKGRHGRGSHDHAVIAWLRTGSVIAALGAALATGHGVASAETGADGSASSANHANASSNSPAAGRAKKTTTGKAKITSTGAEKSPTSGTESAPASGTDATMTGAQSSHPPVSTAHTKVDPNPRTSRETPPPATTTRKRAVIKAKPVAALATRVSGPSPTTGVAPAVVPLSLAKTATSRVTPSALIATAASSTTPSAITVTPAAAATPVVTLSGIVTDILTWFGQPPLPVNSPVPALPVPDPFASLWVGVRQIEYRINNRTPTANPTSSAQDPQTGVITGNVNATDLDGDPLAYAVTGAPTHGTVTVNSDGSYTYSPSTDFALTGGSDTVRIQISETNAATHIHGIKGLFAKLVNALSGGRVKLPDGSTTTAILQLVVMPTGTVVNHAPAAPTTEGAVTYDPATGIATGTTGFTDPDGDSLTYTVTTNPTYGTVTVAANGNYTYTPTSAGRAQAATTPGLTDNFTVTASDGQLSTPTSLQVTVTAATQAATISQVRATQTLGSPGYTIVVTADQPLTYTVDTGTLTANIDGSYTYLAAPAAQHGPVSFALTGTDTSSQTTTTQVTLAYFTGVDTYVDTNGTPYVFQTVTFRSIGTPDTVYENGSVLNTERSSSNDANGVYTQTYRLAYPGDTVATDRISVRFIQFDPQGNGTSNRVVDFTALAVAAPTVGTPTVGTPDPSTGTVTGTLNFTDPAGLPLVYTVTGNPSLGALAISSGGGFSYTPTTSARSNAAAGGPTADAFTVTAANLAGASAAVTVTVPISPTPAVVNHAPIAPTTQGAVTYDPATGIATGNLGFTDPDGDPLTYTVTTTPTYGSVTVATNGNYTYTPTPAGRGQAATTPGLTDAFTVTASDGQLTTPTALQVIVTPTVASGPVSIHVGINPEQVVVSPDGSTIYVTNNGRFVSSGQPHVGDSVSVISTATNTVIKTIQVGNHPSGVAITPDGSTVYVANFDDNTVSVISTATNTVISTIPVSGHPRRIVVTADGSKALVVNTNADISASGTLSVIDTATKTVASPIIGLGLPSAVVTSSNGNVIYVTSRQSSSTSVIVGGTITRLVYTGGQHVNESDPVSAVLDGNTLYVADAYYGQVTVVDLAGNDGNGAITQRINLPVTPTQIVGSLDGQFLYVGGGNAIVKVDVATGNVTTLATITDAEFQGITLSPEGTVLYATNPGTANESDDNVLVFPLV